MRPFERRLAAHHLARLRGGVSDFDRDAILAVWPDCPVEGDLGALDAWLDEHADAKTAMIRADALVPPKPEGWQIYTLEDAYSPRPPVRYVVEGLFPLPSLSIVYGAPGCFKSMLLGDLAVCVAAGLPWLPPLPDQDKNTARATLAVPVLWCDFDNGPRTMHERLEALGKARNLPPDAPLYYVSMPSPWLDASDFDSVTILADLVLSLETRLIVIDNLRDISGGVDENSAAMGDVLSNLRRLSEDTGAAVVVIHHQRKGNGTLGRRGDTLRGHSSIEAAIDLALLVEREEYADTVQLRATKVRGADVLPFGARFTYTWKPGTKELEKVKFYGVPVEDLTSDAAIRRVLLELVGETPGIVQKELTEAAKTSLPDIGINRIRSQINYLVSEGELMVQSGGKYNAKHYSLPRGQEIEPLHF